MFGHYLKITWRSVLGQKLYALINIGGLAIGITCFILIGMYVHYELSFDGDIPNEEHIYRVIQRQKGNEYLGTDYFAVMPAPAAKTIADQYPEVEAAVALQPQSAIMGIATRNLSTENGFWAEKGFFEIFEPLFLHGNPDLVFDKPNGLVITRALSHKLFGTANSLGKLVKLNDADFEITGIVEDPPQNSSLQYNFIQSISNQPNYKEQSWFNNSPYVFLKLAEDANPKAFEAKLSSLLGEHQNSEDYPFEGKLHLEALSKIYFNTK
ncbi:MAG: ABC transporter permease, partial [Bacteroidota bacterium]